MNGIQKKTVLLLTVASMFGLQAMDDAGSLLALAINAREKATSREGKIAIGAALAAAAGTAAYKYWKQPKQAAGQAIDAAIVDADDQVLALEQPVAAVVAPEVVQPIVSKAEADTAMLIGLLSDMVEYHPNLVTDEDKATVQSLIEQVITKNNPTLLIQNDTFIKLFDKDPIIVELVSKLCPTDAAKPAVEIETNN